jgi:hypothetical protein
MNPLLETEELTLQRYGEYCLRQAQFLARMFQPTLHTTHANVVHYLSIILIQHDLSQINLDDLAIGIPSAPSMSEQERSVHLLSIQTGSASLSFSNDEYDSPHANNTKHSPIPSSPAASQRSVQLKRQHTTAAKPQHYEKASTPTSISSRSTSRSKLERTATQTKASTPRSVSHHNHEKAGAANLLSSKTMSSSSSTVGYGEQDALGYDELVDADYEEETKGFFGFELKVSVPHRRLSPTLY